MCTLLGGHIAEFLIMSCSEPYSWSELVAILRIDFSPQLLRGVCNPQTH